MDITGKVSSLELKKHYNNVLPTVVAVEVEVPVKGGYEYQCKGLGVFVTSEGRVVTAASTVTVEGSRNIRIRTTFGNGDRFVVEDKGVNKSSGLAILEPLETLKVPFANISEDCDFGDQVFCIGNPGYLEFSLIVGQVSYPCRKFGDVKPTLSLVDHCTKSAADYDFDTSAEYICYYPSASELGFDNGLSLIQFNNVHGDGPNGGSSGTIIFDFDDHVVSIYSFLMRDQVYGIHGKEIKALLEDRILASEPIGGKKKRKGTNVKDRKR